MTSRTRTRRRRFRAGRLPGTVPALACALVALAAGGGCGDGDDALPTAPAAPELGTRYLPAGEDVVVARDAWYDFRVIAAAGAPLQVRWLRPGQPEAVGERYRYFARALGDEILAARIVDPDGRTWTRTWSVAVVPAGRPRVDFLPAIAAVDAYATVEAVFAVSTPWPVTATAWRLDGADAGHDTLLSFVPDAPGPRVVEVAVVAGDSAFARTWTVAVHPFADARPPAVSGLVALPGDAPGRALLAWNRTDGSVLPLVAYEVRYRREGPPTEASWPTDPDPGGFAWSPDQARPQVQYTPAGAGLEPGAEVWFAVRARNDRGQLSPLAETAYLRLPGEWWLEGTVRDPDGAPLAGIPVGDRDRLHGTLTGADGGYRLGPYFELAPVTIEAGTGADAPPGAAWHASRSASLGAAGTRRQDFLLIPRLGTAPGCFVFGSHFTWYLRTMTRTRVTTPRRPDLRLYRWQDYPIPVHVPDWVSPLGVDFGACIRDALDLWNESLGEPYFVRVDDPQAARLGFRYDLVADINYGVVEMDEPGAGELVIGDAVPEHVSVRLTPIMPDIAACTEIALHELGHVLGLLDHAHCNSVPYLMNVSPLGALDRGRDRAIHPDELNAVRLIRILPNGLDMGAYPLDVP